MSLIGEAPGALPPSAGEVTRVVIVDDHPLVRDGLRMIIDAEPGMTVCADAADAGQARRVIRQSNPHVAVIDLSLRGGGSGLDLVKWTALRHPQTRVVILSLHDEEIFGERALRAGAAGYVCKSRPARTILAAIRRVTMSEFYFSKELVQRVLRNAASGVHDELSAVDRLSDRELEVFRCIGEGLTTKEIAATLHLSISTVDTYRDRLKVKLGARNGAQLAAAATRWTLEHS
ncbi:MAG: response regulator [Gammaproteobacteria bacterium]